MGELVFYNVAFKVLGKSNLKSEEDPQLRNMRFVSPYLQRKEALVRNSYQAIALKKSIYFYKLLRKEIALEVADLCFYQLPSYTSMEMHYKDPKY